MPETISILQSPGGRAVAGVRGACRVRRARAAVRLHEGRLPFLKEYDYLFKTYYYYYY